jgi:tRNA (mo5U34)-methyltransferase
LDVGTWDGFWAFEMERRGAAGVVAIDLDDASRWDWPEPAPEASVKQFRAAKCRNEAFYIAQQALDSKVERVELSVYDLSQESVGHFDFAFIGSLLLHLRDPVRALIAIRRVLTGELLCADQISLTLSLLRPRRPAADLAALDLPHWWTPNIAGLKRLVQAAGFEVLRTGGPYLLVPGPGAPRLPLRSGVQFARRFGTPHAWVAAQPSIRCEQLLG